MPASKDATPIRKQYLEIKSQYPDTILFFRLGDFYETFGEDAIRTSEILGITLTKRHNTPMCGIPYHAAAGYLERLVKAGVKVAICEQVEDPRTVKGGKIVKRDVVRVVTPGVTTDEQLLDEKRREIASLMKPFMTEGT